MKRPIDLPLLAALSIAAALAGGTIGWELASLTFRLGSASVPTPPAVVDGPVEPILYRSTWCPPPELRGPEPTLDLSPEDR